LTRQHREITLRGRSTRAQSLGRQSARLGVDASFHGQTMAVQKR